MYPLNLDSSPDEPATHWRKMLNLQMPTNLHPHEPIFSLSYSASLMLRSPRLFDDVCTEGLSPRRRSANAARQCEDWEDWAASAWGPRQQLTDSFRLRYF